MGEVKVHICRFHTPNQTFGDLIVNKDGKGIYDCKTLELPWLDNKRRISCVPAGTYWAIKHKSPKFGNCIWILDVPDRDEILCHGANFVGSKNPKTGKSDLLGCIAPGTKYADITGDNIKEILESKKALKGLLAVLPDKFQIVIE